MPVRRQSSVVKSMCRTSVVLNSRKCGKMHARASENITKKGTFSFSLSHCLVVHVVFCCSTHRSPARGSEARAASYRNMHLYLLQKSSGINTTTPNPACLTTFRRPSVNGPVSSGVKMKTLRKGQLNRHSRYRTATSAKTFLLIAFLPAGGGGPFSVGSFRSRR